VVRAVIESEVSSIDGSVTTLAGPALSTRKTSTEFNVQAGETLVLSGLISRKNSNSIDKIPGLGDIPILGALFRSKRFQNDETELVVFVTPTIVDSQTPKLVERIQRAQERLQNNLGSASYLTDPLQPQPQPEPTPEPEPVPQPDLQQQLILQPQPQPEPASRPVILDVLPPPKDKEE
jgi:Flp pilus assembly secretin CpaC